MTYDEALIETANDGIYVIDNLTFESDAKGLINGDVIGLSKDIETSIERTCILMEERGHYRTGIGNIFDQAIVENRKQELKARLFAYQQLVTPEKLILAKKYGCRNVYEMAEFLEVTESFLQSAIDAYRHIYGCAQQIGDYLFTFDPAFNIYKMQ